MFALTNRAPVASGAANASRGKAASVSRVSVAAPARSQGLSLVPTLATSQRASTITLASSRDVSVDAKGRAEVKGESTRLTIKKGDPSNFALGILGDLHMDPRDLEHSFEGREHMKAILAKEENTFVVGLYRDLVCWSWTWPT